MPLTRCSPRARVFRLVNVGTQTFPPGAEKPLPGEFRPTDDDISEGLRRGLPPLLSVWDHAKTTIRQAKAFSDRPRERRAFGWSVDTIEAIQVTGHGGLQCFEDPLLHDARPGASGHCGISGLVPDGRRAKGPEKLIYKEVQSRLAELCRPISERRNEGGPIARKLLFIGVVVLLLAIGAVVFFAF